MQTKDLAKLLAWDNLVGLKRVKEGQVRSKERFEGGKEGRKEGGREVERERERERDPERE